MKQISYTELLSLYGGKIGNDCMTILQYEASTHLKTSNQEAEDKYWDDWADRYADCYAKMNRQK